MTVLKEIIRFWLLLRTMKLLVDATDTSSFGNFLTEDQASNLELCSSKFCLLDAGRLLEAATSDRQVNPCEDFKEFSMGNFIKYRALHDRYDRVGFLYDVLSTHQERQRKALKASIVEGESRVFKIVKNFFQQCVDSGNIFSFSA